MLADILPCYPFTNVMMVVTDRQDIAWHFRVSFGSFWEGSVKERMEQSWPSLQGFVGRRRSPSKQSLGANASPPPGLGARPAQHCTCTDETGEAPVDDFVIVGQYERTPSLNLQTVLLARDRLSAVQLRNFKVLGTQPGFVDNLKQRRIRNVVPAGTRKIHFGVKRQEQKGKEYKSNNIMIGDKGKECASKLSPTSLHGKTVFETC